MSSPFNWGRSAARGCSEPSSSLRSKLASLALAKVLEASPRQDSSGRNTRREYCRILQLLSRCTALLLPNRAIIGEKGANPSLAVCFTLPFSAAGAYHHARPHGSKPWAVVHDGKQRESHRDPLGGCVAQPGNRASADGIAIVSCLVHQKRDARLAQILWIAVCLHHVCTMFAPWVSMLAWPLAEPRRGAH